MAQLRSSTADTASVWESGIFPLIFPTKNTDKDKRVCIRKIVERHTSLRWPYCLENDTREPERSYATNSSLGGCKLPDNVKTQAFSSYIP